MSMNFSSLLWTRTFIDWHSVFFHLVLNGNHVEDYNITQSGAVCKFPSFLLDETGCLALLENITMVVSAERVQVCISNGNRTEWSPIRSVIIRVINKMGRPRSGSPICLITSDERKTGSRKICTLHQCSNTNCLPNDPISKRNF